MTWVKICGITRVEDALAAVESGADAIGFVFYPPSPRSITPERAAAIAEALPRGLAKIGVFVNETIARMTEIRARAGLDCIQLHGDEPAEMALALACPAIRAFRAIRDVEEAAAIARYPAAAVLVDGERAGFYGGTGAPAAHGAIAAARRAKRWILSGGLAPESVAAKIAAFTPWGVDVSTGVESSPGIKDQNKIAAFVAAVRASGSGPSKAAGRSGASSLSPGRSAA